MRSRSSITGCFLRRRQLSKHNVLLILIVVSVAALLSCLRSLAVCVSFFSFVLSAFGWRPGSREAEWRDANYEPPLAAAFGLPLHAHDMQVCGPW